MARPKKSVQASRTNGGRAKNKGKLKHLQTMVDGDFNEAGEYVIESVKVRRYMPKGEVRTGLDNPEPRVFTYCVYHSKFVVLSDDKERDGQCDKPVDPDRWDVDPDRWEAAAKKARRMLDQCATLDARAKIAKLRSLTKGAKVPIKFKC